MKKSIKGSLILAVSAGLLLAPLFAGAIVTEPIGQGSGTFGSLTGVTSFIEGTVLGLIKWAFWVLAIIMVIYAAFVYLTAGGDPEKVSKASHMLLYAVVAMAVALLATILPGFVRSIVGY
ncbi:MAG: hypothetical protein LiPW15_745 [Parcubacteria group bacterium LiPW_15]|nr:MAG: hypothetical protein LiPW15_745 [Parcubacteria group bacterium LiPW_15]